ncbi:hypothetical protein [Aquisalibacillus elongatus]|uniref:hypothetical protein n=1 Tax=Aquisalibacillus elongatus TaxID=485577 RepID=UPI00147663F6|nr:hypothetical protein [Aquisalibacillus elongatus]
MRFFYRGIFAWLSGISSGYAEIFPSDAEILIVYSEILVWAPAYTESLTLLGEISSGHTEILSLDAEILTAHTENLLYDHSYTEFF